eukprot:TRINITY_DN2958_c0_g4_i2.p1 TRINITY_DN2958_c0_g4~~TRINITY_DN2958_c0_g4_i2.p1  ORF type:complete len:1314 (-),score=237.49 TRINITY_DN2958_c0_g4_i2:263-4204(-)
MDILVTCTDQTLRVIDVTTSKAKRDIKLEFGLQYTDTCFGPLGHLYGIVGTLEDGLIFDPKSRTATHWLKGHRDKLTCCAWDSTGLKIATGSFDQTCRIWDVRKASEPLHIQPSCMATVRSCKFSNNGHFLAIGEEVDFVQICDMRDLSATQTVERFGEISGISFTPDDSSLYIAIADPSRVYGADTSQRASIRAHESLGDRQASLVSDSTAIPHTPITVAPVGPNADSHQSRPTASGHGRMANKGDQLSQSVPEITRRGRRGGSESSGLPPMTPKTPAHQVRTHDRGISEGPADAASTPAPPVGPGAAEEATQSDTDNINDDPPARPNLTVDTEAEVPIAIPGTPPLSAVARKAMESGSDIWIGSLFQLDAVEKLVKRDRDHYKMNEKKEEEEEIAVADEASLAPPASPSLGALRRPSETNVGASPLNRSSTNLDDSIYGSWESDSEGTPVKNSLVGFSKQALGDSRIALQHAIALFEAHTYTGCIQYCTRAIKTDMLTELELGRALYLRGQAYCASRDYPNAIHDFDQALATLGSDSKEDRAYRIAILLDRGYLLLYLHRFDDALGCVLAARDVHGGSDAEVGSVLEKAIADMQEEVDAATAEHADMLKSLSSAPSSNFSSNSNGTSSLTGRETPLSDKKNSVVVHSGALHECTTSGNRRARRDWILTLNVLVCPSENKKYLALSSACWVDKYTVGGPFAFALIFPESVHAFTAPDAPSLNRWLEKINCVISYHRPAGTSFFLRRLRYKYRDGGVYNGDYLLGQRMGAGTHIYAVNRGQVDDDASFSMVEKWVGEWRDDKPHRHGTYYYANGDKYIGEMKAGQRHGSGKLRSVDGSVYDGRWRDDQRDGPGTLKNADGSHYTGEWKGGMKDGIGLMIYSDGKQYSGRWRADKFHGHGIVSSMGRLVYDGEWQDGHKHGSGKIIYKDNSQYEGMWKDDMRHGQGVQRSPDGTTYSGEWWTDFRCGFGVLTMPSGDYITGNWAMDKGQVDIRSARFHSALDDTYVGANSEVQQEYLVEPNTTVWEALFSTFTYDEASRRRDEPWMRAPVAATLVADLLSRLQNPEHPLGILLSEFDLTFRSKKEGSFGATRTSLDRAFVNDILSFVNKLDNLIISIYPHLKRIMPINQRLRCIYHVVFDKIYEPLLEMYKAKYHEEDRRTKEVFEELADITPAHCFSSKKFHLQGVAQPYDPPIQTLRSIPMVRDPVVKLEKLVHASRQIEECILDYYGDAKAPEFGADVSWPIFQYILIKASPEDPVSQLNLLRDFFDSQLEDMEGFSYRLMVLEATLELIVTLQWDRVDDDGVLLPLDVEE